MMSCNLDVLNVIIPIFGLFIGILKELFIFLILPLNLQTQYQFFNLPLNK